MSQHSTFLKLTLIDLCTAGFMVGSVVAHFYGLPILSTALWVFPLVQLASLLLQTEREPLEVYRFSTAAPTFAMVYFLAWVLFK